MGLFDKIKMVFTGNSEQEVEFEKIVAATLKECLAAQGDYWSPDLSKAATWTEQVKNWPDGKRINFIAWLVERVHRSSSGKASFVSGDRELHLNYVRLAYLQALFRNKLTMDDKDAVSILQAFRQYRTRDHANITNWPIALMVNQLQKQRQDQAMSPALRGVLENVKTDLDAINNAYQEKDRIKLVEKIDALLFADKAGPTDAIKPVRFLGDDPFAEKANAVIENMPAEERTYWYKLLPLAQKATGSKPSKKFLDDTKTIIKELGTDKFKKTIHEWLQFLVSLKEQEEVHSNVYNGRTYTYSTYEYISSVNAEAVKGLVWACSHFHDGATIQTIAALAERAFKKIPGKGPAAASIGNACLYVLYKSKGLDGIGQLSRLKLRIKQASTQSLIDKYLEAAATEQGVTVNEIEDMAVDDGGLENGRRVFLFDDYKAELIITGVGKTEQKWYKPDGSLQKSLPTIVKERHASRLKKLKDTAKLVEQTVGAQRDRIDRMLRTNRKIPWENFKEHYLEHGLMSYLTGRIIWNFHQQGKTVQAILLNDQWVNAANETVTIHDTETVSLWHPVQASLTGIKAWRDFLVLHQLQQPLKQAFREVYLLTDAEVNTKTYSNRMAAHVLRQHQFNSLAKTRGWRYSLMGAFDNGIDSGVASLQLPEHNLRAEYWINEVNADGQMNDTGIWNYVATDQVRFINTGTEQVVDLVDIPPLVLSEVLRDVDLFVGVASVGNDPAWQDSGGLPAYRDYWTSYSFGELSEVAKNRKEILSGLVPRLKIRDVAAIKDKFLVVKGKLRTYKIHIGSTNILMEPNDQYLCIVPDRGKKDHTENLFLPFEGDNGLSIILSKAFLLAEDDKITDSTILSQIRWK